MYMSVRNPLYSIVAVSADKIGHHWRTRSQCTFDSGAEWFRLFIWMLQWAKFTFSGQRTKLDLKMYSFLGGEVFIELSIQTRNRDRNQTKLIPKVTAIDSLRFSLSMAPLIIHHPKPLHNLAKGTENLLQCTTCEFRSICDAKNESWHQTFQALLNSKLWGFDLCDQRLLSNT